MKINKKITVLLIVFSTLFVYAEETGDDIFQNQKIEDNDFYDIQIEPSKQELKDGVSAYFEEVKRKKLNILKNLEAERNKLNSSKENMKSAREAQKEQLAKKKAAMKGSKKAVSTAEKPTGSELKEPEQRAETEKAAEPEIKAPESKPAAEKSAETKNPPKKTKPANPVREQKKEKSERTVEEAEIEMTNSVSAREKFIDCGLSLQGTKYVWGGKTPVPGLDCSGLITYTAKNSLGLDVRGNAQDIYNQTVPVSLGDAEPGDLIFFKGEYDSRVTHVGIYLGKNPGKNDFGKQNLFLNAASAGPRTGVIISGLNENYWKKTFYNCGRLINSVE